MHLFTAMILLYSGCAQRFVCTQKDIQIYIHWLLLKYSFTSLPHYQYSLFPAFTSQVVLIFTFMPNSISIFSTSQSWIFRIYNPRSSVLLLVPDSISISNNPLRLEHTISYSYMRLDIRYRFFLIFKFFPEGSHEYAE